MGYTHYWDFKIKKGQVKAAQAAYERACKAVSKACKLYNKTVHDEYRLSGFSAHAPVGKYTGIYINGKGELQHEDFSTREHITMDSGGFCKTAQKPYDTAVVAALILLKHYLGESMEVSSDGDASDWLEGLRLAKSICPSAKIPSSIRGVPLKALVGA